jgi:hypothetical protein
MKSINMDGTEMTEQEERELQEQVAAAMVPYYAVWGITRSAQDEPLSFEELVRRMREAKK